MPAHPRETSDEQCQAFWRAAEAAKDVHDRYQFFVWLRLHLNHFIPHDFAACFFREPGLDVPAIKVDLFNSVPVGEGLMAELADGGSRWWRALEHRWAGGSRQAVVIALAELAGSAESDALMAAGFRALLFHAFDSNAGMRPETAFVFALRQNDLGESHQRRMEFNLNLCLPVLHCAAVRAVSPSRSTSHCVEEAHDTAPRDAERATLTRRQIQIISAVRDAKQNSQIGEMLGISPATVKNHLHTIMRKLNASNRAQAVAEAMSRRLIS